MKRVLYILLVVLPIVSMARTSEQNVDLLFEAANKYYTSGKYNEAVQHYEAIIAKGKVSPELYFNLGNAYFKLNDIAHAILNYERAHLLDPNDEDIKFNLELARTYTTDKIETIPDFFVTKWINHLSNLFCSNTWALIALVAFVITLVLLSIFQFSNQFHLKKNSFWFSWVFGFLFVVSLLFSNAQKNRVTNSNHAIITSSSVAVKSSPSENSNDLFILHAGTKIESLRNVGNWCEIKIADGSKGWLLKSNFEMI